MTKHQQQVREFMKAVGQIVRDKPEMPTLAERRRFAFLILEEVFETIEDGLALEIINEKGEQIHAEDFGIRESAVNTPDLVEFMDGLGDCSVIINGGACMGGTDLEPIELEIDRSNATKADGGYKDESTGKWIKPPTYSPANIAPIIEAQKA